MGQERRRQIDKDSNIIDGGYLSLENNNNKHVCVEKDCLTGEWLATDIYPPSALEQAYHFLLSGELDRADYYLVRWRHYEQSYEFEPSP